MFFSEIEKGKATKFESMTKKGHQTFWWMDKHREFFWKMFNVEKFS